MAVGGWVLKVGLEEGFGLGSNLKKASFIHSLLGRLKKVLGILPFNSSFKVFLLKGSRVRVPISFLIPASFNKLLWPQFFQIFGVPWVP